MISSKRHVNIKITMLKSVSFVVLILTMVVAVIAVVVDVSPETAQSNFAAWAELLGAEDMERVITPIENRTVFWAALAMIVVCLFTLLRAQIKRMLRWLLRTDKARFRELAPDIAALSERLNGENEGVKTLPELRMGTKTVTMAKLLIHELEKLGIRAPGIRNIDRWIDWLPRLQKLAEEGRLKDARKLDPHKPTLQQYNNIDERVPLGYQR